MTLTLLLGGLPFAAAFANDADVAKNRDDERVVRRARREMPTISKDQRRGNRPVAVDCGSPLDPYAEPCNDDWDDSGGSTTTEVIAGKTCPQLCTVNSCGTKLADHACRTESNGTYKYCAEVAFRFCDSYTYVKSGLTTCATCLQ